MDPSEITIQTRAFRSLTFAENRPASGKNSTCVDTRALVVHGVPEVRETSPTVPRFLFIGCSGGDKMYVDVERFNMKFDYINGLTLVNVSIVKVEQ